MNNRSHSWIRLTARHLVLVIVCLLTLSIGIPAFGDPPLPNYTVTFDENASVSDPVGTFEIGTAAIGLTLFANLSPKFTNSGHTFTGWNTAANGTGTAYSNGATYSFSADIELFAQWAVVQTNYTVTFNENDSASDSLTAFEIGTAAIGLTLFARLSPTFTNSGHTFTGWNTAANGTGTAYSNGATYSFSADIELFAQWAVIPTIAASFDSNGGAGAVSSLSGLVGTSVSLPSSSGFSSPGYTFAGWNTAADGSGSSYASGTTFVLNTNQILYAQWSPNQYVVTFSPNGGSVNVASSTYTYGGTTLTLPTPTNANAAFNGWYSALTGGTLIGAAGASYTPGQTLTLYAQWSPNQYVVTYAPDGGIVNVTSSTFVYGDSALTLPASTDTNFTFNGWYSALTGGTLIGAAGASYTPGQTLTLYAQWSPNQYVVTYAPDGGTVDVTSSTFVYGSTPLTLRAPTNTNFTFDGWFTAPSGGTLIGAAGASYQPTQSLTLYAQWTQIPSIVLSFVSNGGGGTVAPLSGLLNSSVTLPGLSGLVRPGYTLTSWNTALDGTGASYLLGQLVTLTIAMTLYAQWTTMPLVDVSFASNGGSGLVSAVSGSPNSSVTLPGSSSLARPGYTLSSWNVAPDGTGRSYALGQNVTLSTSLTLYAQWTALSTIELKFVTDGGSGSAAPLIGVVGANVTLPGSTSVVKSGFTFTSWNTTANGSGTSFKLGEGVTLSTSMTLYAQWKGTPTAVLYGAVGLFAKSSTKLTPSLKTQIQELAKTIKAKNYKKVTLFGYSVATGTTSLDREISAARATVVADFLRSQLEWLKVQGVSITAAGEGSIVGKTAPTYARVEVFVL